MLLAWDDGYCDFPKPRDSVQRLSSNVCFNDTRSILSFGCEANSNDGSSDGYSIGLAVSNMSCLLYALGEGAVGKVALTGKHSWNFTHEFNSKFVHEYPDEWQVQFAIGIKTILLVPVAPHGVVQLGSTEMVMENLKLVAHIKNLFDSTQNVSEDSLPFSSMKQETLMKKEPMVPDVGHLTANKPSAISSHVSPLLMVQDSLPITQKTMQHILGTDKGQCVDGNASHTMYHDMLSQDLTEVLDAQKQYMNDLENISTFVRLEEELCFSSQCSAANTQQSGQHSGINYHENHNEQESDLHVNLAATYNLGETVEDQFGIAAAEISREFSHSLLSFPGDSELHKVLGPAFQKSCIWDAIVSRDGCNGSSLIGETDWTEDVEPSVAESNGWFVTKGSKEHLLDAVVANMHSASEECAFNTFNNLRSPSSSSGQLAASCQTESRSEAGVLTDDLGPWCLVNGDVFNSSPTGSSSRATSTLIDDGPQKIEPGYAESKRGAKSYQINKRKTRTGDVQRARPRDRQMIQDRVKELREIVPDGAKCSIDSLLERTIKHMLFLRNVTDQAEKLKQCPKVTGNENRNSSSFLRHQNDASWAFELGSQSGVCPIIVENLDHPGHMLVEMLCEEHGFFLEIAQVIRHLELTILKGVMENRSDKIWAHFIVEASKGFQRMDILWPLMQLLQRNHNLISSKF